MKDINGLFIDNGFKGIIVLLNEVLDIEDINKNFETLLGYEKKDVIGMTFTNHIIPDEKSFLFDMIYGKNDLKTKVIRLYHASGAYRYFSIDIYSFADNKILFGKPIEKEFESISHHSRVSEIDGSEVKSINVKNIYDLIDVDNQMLTYLFDILPLDVWIKDIHGRYVFVNQSHQNSTGLKKEDMLRKEDYEIFGKEIAKSFVDSDYFAIQSKKPLQYVFETKDEKLPQYTQVTKFPLFNDNQDYIGLLSFAVDVTEMKELQIKREKQYNHLYHALKNFEGIIFESDYIGNTYFINGSMVQHLPKKSITDINMYEIFELLGVKVESIKDVNRVLVHRDEKVLHLHNNKSIRLKVIPFEAMNGDTHLLGIGVIVDDES